MKDILTQEEFVQVRAMLRIARPGWDSSSDLDEDPDGEYYVYVYLDTSKPGKFAYWPWEFDYEPFYVGKGKKYRAKVPHTTRKNPVLSRKIRSLFDAGFTPKGRICLRGMSEEGAFSVEKDLIAKIGRKFDKSGPLCNLTAGGEGYSSADPSVEAKRKANWRAAMESRSVEDIVLSDFRAAERRKTADPKIEKRRRERISAYYARKRGGLPKARERRRQSLSSS